MGLAYMPLFVTDWIADTRGLSFEERGAYIEILSHLWNAKGGACTLPAGDAELAKIIGARIDVWRRLKVKIGPLLVWSGDTVSHARLREEYVRAKAKSDAAERARAGKSRTKVGEKSDKNPTLIGLSQDFLERKSAETQETGGQSKDLPYPYPYPQVTTKKKKEPAPASPTPPGFREFHDEFTARYERATGSKPSWDRTTGAIVKGLLGKQPLEELVRRLDVFFGNQGPDWITERDLKTFAGHLDKFVAVAPPKPKVANPENEFRRVSMAELRTGSWRTPTDTPQKRISHA